MQPVLLLTLDGTIGFDHVGMFGALQSFVASKPKDYSWTDLSDVGT